jgi:light-regulated signal transduction histidine kinase (bacteriophytochrome)
MQNLVGNALKYRRPDVAPAIKISGEIKKSANNSGRGPILLMSVMDNGIGFENQFREKIFTIFQRLHSRNEYEGTGIGLATVRKIVERHGGKIEADGEPNVGATFNVTLPLSQQNPEGQQS